MRFSAMVMLVLAGCSSSEVTTTITSSSGSAQKPSPSAAKSAAAPSASAAAAPAASGSAPPAATLKDAEAELKTIDPFNDAATDGAQRLLTAMTLCGEPTLSNAPWGRDVADDKPAAAPPTPTATRCSAESHAKLYMRSASMLADSKDAGVKKTAEEHAYYALALDPKAALPAGANAAATATVAAAKKRPAPEFRIGEVSTTDGATSKELKQAAAGELGAGVRLCYAAGLLNNPNLQGTLGVEADVAADGTLSGVKILGSLPDAGVVACVARFSARSKVNAPSKTPTRVAIPFVVSPGGK